MEFQSACPPDRQNVQMFRYARWMRHRETELDQFAAWLLRWELQLAGTGDSNGQHYCHRPDPMAFYTSPKIHPQHVRGSSLEMGVASRIPEAVPSNQQLGRRAFYFACSFFRLREIVRSDRAFTKIMRRATNALRMVKDCRDYFFGAAFFLGAVFGAAFCSL